MPAAVHGQSTAVLLPIGTGAADAIADEDSPDRTAPEAETAPQPPGGVELSGYLSQPATDDALSQRVTELEAQLKKMQAADEQAAARAAQRFTVRPFGRLHLDAATFSQDADNRTTVGPLENGVDIRRARLGAEGEGFDIFFYRFDFDVVGIDPQLQTRVVIADAYLDVQQLPILGNIRVGHFREPFSLDRLDSTNDLPFMERALSTNALTPFRNIGLMAFDWNNSETATWAYGVFNENTDEYGEYYDDNGAAAFTTRATWLPYYDEPAKGRYMVHVGGSYSYRHLGPPERRFGVPPEIGLRSGSLRTANFVDTGVLRLDDYHVAGLEACAVWGSLSMQGEYVVLAANETNGSTPVFHGGYVEAMYWLTGENRQYNRRSGTFGAVPLNSNFFRVRTEDGRICTGPGAWELTARLSNLNLTSADVAGGELADVTLGLNWYYAVRCRVMFNYVHSLLDRSNLTSNADICGLRFQYAF